MVFLGIAAIVGWIGLGTVAHLLDRRHQWYAYHNPPMSPWWADLLCGPWALFQVGRFIAISPWGWDGKRAPGAQWRDI